MRRAVPSLAVLASIAAVVATAAAGGPATTVSPPHQLSGPSPFGSGRCGVNDTDQESVGIEYEPSLAVEPVHRQLLAATWMQDGVGNVVSVSRDGGDTWALQPLPGMSLCSGEKDYTIALDPGVATGPDQRVYASALLGGWGPLLPTSATTPAGGLGQDTLVDYNFPPLGSSAIAVTVSSDGGRHFAPATRVTTDPVPDEIHHHDHPLVAADPNTAGLAYVVYDTLTLAGGSVQMVSTSDGGAHWSAPRDVWTPGVGTDVGAQSLLVLDDGSLLLITGSIPASAIVTGVSSQDEPLSAMVSRDHGVHWSSPQPISTMPFGTASATVTHDGTAHVVFADRAGMLHDARARSPYTSWSVTDVGPAERGMALTPAVAAATNGTLAVLFYDQRSESTHDITAPGDWWLRSSHDGGTTWTESHVDGPFDLSKPTKSASGFFPLGDYFGFAATRNGFGAVIVDPKPRVTDGDTDAYYVSIATAGGAAATR